MSQPTYPRWPLPLAGAGQPRRCPCWLCRCRARSGLPQ